MTKYSKIKKSSFAILALSLILVAVLAFGGTYAYFSATATGTSETVTAGTISLTDPITISVQADKVVPGQDVLTAPIKVTHNSNIDTFILVKITNTAGTGIVLTPELGNIEKVGTTDYYAYKVADSNYKVAKVAAATDLTLMSKLYFDNTNDKDDMGATFTITVTAYALQADFLNAENGVATGTIDSADDVYNAFRTYYPEGLTLFAELA